LSSQIEATQSSFSDLLLFESDAESILITKHGKPVAKLVPVDADADDIYNFLAGKESITGVVVSSALSDDRRVSI